MVLILGVWDLINNLKINANITPITSNYKTKNIYYVERFKLNDVYEIDNFKAQIY